MGSQHFLRVLLAACVALTLSACGGGGGSGASFVDDGSGTGGGGGGGSDTPTAAAISLTLPDGAQLAADADTVAEGLSIVAIAVDANNNAVSGVPVAFSATSGELSVGDSTTDGNGRATAVLTTASNTTLRDITVLVSAGGLQATVVVTVVAPANNANPQPRLGTIDGSGNFLAGQIGIAVSPVSAGGSSALRVDVVDIANGNAVVTDPVSVTFTSPCITSGIATVDPNPAIAANGAATTTYVASGCSGDDQITARAVIGGTNQTAQGTINVLPSSLGSIEFVSASPTNIGLRGSGGQVTSTVQFLVRNSVGGAIPGQTVTFSLNTEVGGITLEPASGVTNAQGIAQTVVRAGTVSTAVRVTATAVQNGVTATSQSELLSITTGVPDQDSYSLSAECFNLEGLNRDGVSTQITLRGADRYNNPVPDGTAVNLTTEGGSVVGSCSTTGGVCSVAWTSQNPRPLAYNNCVVGGAENTDANCAIGGLRGASRAGRSTVLAFSVGEESFSDADGDGLFDGSEGFGDLPEAFLDLDEDGVRDDASHNEVFFDFNSAPNTQGAFDLADGQYNGLLCDNGNPDNVQCPDPQTLHVRDSLTIIMSGSSPAFDVANDISVSGATSFNPGTRTIVVPSQGLFLMSAVIRDINDQPMPATTSITFTGGGDAGATEGSNTFAVPCTTDDTAGGNTYGVAFAAAELDPGDPDESGILELRVTSPSGVVSILPFTVITTAPALPAP